MSTGSGQRKGVPMRQATSRRGHLYWRPAGRDWLFWRKVDTPLDGCWEWQGRRTHLGYGRLGRRRVTDNRVIELMAHRYGWEDLYGPLDPALDLDHLCRNRRCCRPGHLEPVTPLVNMQRSAPATKTHCVNGHPLPLSTPGPNGRIRRNCQECIRVRRALSGRTLSCPLCGNEIVKSGMSWHHVANGVRDCPSEQRGARTVNREATPATVPSANGERADS